jgi:hypothetical protein
VRPKDRQTQCVECVRAAFLDGRGPVQSPVGRTTTAQRINVGGIEGVSSGATNSEGTRAATDEAESETAMANVDDRGGSNWSTERFGPASEAKQMNGRLLFDDGHWIERRHVSTPRHTVTARARCSGCSATALLTSSRRSKWPELPAGWFWCGEMPSGEPRLWCSQCSYERRYDRPSTP